MTFMKNIVRILKAFVFCFVLIFIIGVANYIFALARFDQTHNISVDAAIVLTGGPDRLSDAAQLLSSGATKHLLISGVGGRADLDDLVRVAPTLAPYATCCIDLGHQALNTRGNAEEAAAWARDRGYKSLAIVTAGFHLPRAMLEFRAILPAMDLYPYRAGLSLRQQVLNGSFGNLYAMSLEPVKYMAALLRVSVRDLFVNKIS
jgi:uncharacterized SAM-binding protein YcdF (DUF218 family)